jgi:hypothetical protein
LTRAIRQILLLGTLLAVFPAQAVAASPDAIVRDCIQDGTLNGNYTDSELEAARQQLAGDIDAYGDCYAVLGAAMGANNGPKADASGNDGDSGGTGGSGANGDGKGSGGAKDGKAKDAKQEQGRREIASIDDALATDDPTADEDDSGGSWLPLILTLVALAALATGGGLWYAARHNPAVANALRRVPLPGRRS